MITKDITVRVDVPEDFTITYYFSKDHKMSVRYIYKPNADKYSMYEETIDDSKLLTNTVDPNEVAKRYYDCHTHIINKISCDRIRIVNNELSDADVNRV